MSGKLASLTAEQSLIEAVTFASMATGMSWHISSLAPMMVTGGCLMAQQAAALALRAAGDTIPAQAGATELLLRAANRDRLPAPHTLPFQSQARQSFDRMVAARNSFMHPRGEDWDVDTKVLGAGLMTAVKVVRHLILVQPILPNLIPERDVREFKVDLQIIDDFGDFYAQ